MAGIKGGILGLAFLSALVFYYSISLSALHDGITDRSQFTASGPVAHQRSFRYEFFHVVTSLNRADAKEGLDDIVRSININLDHPLVESMHLIVEDGLDATKYFENPKLTVEYKSSPMTYRGLLESANSYTGGRIVIVTNSVISFDITLSCVKRELLQTKTVFALSSHPSRSCDLRLKQVDNLNTCLHYNDDDPSHDTLIFAPPLSVPMLETLDPSQSAQDGGDARHAIKQLKAFGYTLLNPCLSVVVTDNACVAPRSDRSHPYGWGGGVQGPADTGDRLASAVPPSQLARCFNQLRLEPRRSPAAPRVTATASTSTSAPASASPTASVTAPAAPPPSSMGGGAGAAPFVGTVPGAPTASPAASADPATIPNTATPAAAAAAATPDAAAAAATIPDPTTTAEPTTPATDPTPPPSPADTPKPPTPTTTPPPTPPSSTTPPTPQKDTKKTSSSSHKHGDKNNNKKSSSSKSSSKSTSKSKSPPKVPKPLPPPKPELRVFGGVHAGERCVVIGNGPSLNRMNLSWLKDEITFGTNKIYLGFDRFGFNATYYVSVNTYVITQSVEEIRQHVASPKFLPDKPAVAAVVGGLDRTFLFNSIGRPGFSKNASEVLYEGHTVTFVSMQLAFYMGCSSVILIGVDHSFKQEGKPNLAVVSEGADPNHFDPSYFGAGVTWQNADLKESERAYALAKQMFEDDGREIIDATYGGALTIFPKKDYHDIFGVLPEDDPFP